MSQKYCCVPGCITAAGGGIPVYRFPNPEKNLHMLKTWVEKIGGDLSELDPNYVYRNRRVCRKHFNNVYVYTKRLCPLAVPSLCLSDETVSLQIEDTRHLPTTSSYKNLDVSANLVQTSVSQDETVSLQIEDTRHLPTTSSYKNLDVSANLVQTSVSQVKKKVFSKEQKELFNVIAKMRYQLKKKEKQKQYLKQLAANKLKRTDAFKLLMGKMNEETKTFFAMQITQFGKKAKGRRFSIREKVLALALYKRSPKAYRFLSSFTVLPKRKTLTTLLQKIDLKPGISVNLFEELKKPVAKMKDHHKYCTVIFDEMSISPNLTFCSKKDEVIGLVDDGIVKHKQMSDHVLVFMIRGIFKKFKQPVYFSFCRGSTKTESLKAQIKTVVNAIEATGLRVMATVCDQGSSNRAAINSLLSETRTSYLKNNKEWTGGFFEMNNRKIFPLFDPPHLMKGIRNNLLNKNLIFSQDGQRKIAVWQHIQDLFQRQPGYKGVRLVPKLTAQHVVPKFIPKMKVKHCTQVFSRTVGVALGFMADCGQLPAECKDTADLLLFMDNLFDSVNGSYSKVRNGKIFRCAVTPKSPHHQLWRKSIPILKSMVFIGNNGRKVSVPSLESWIKTIEGFQLLFAHMRSDNMTSMLLRNFNQDPLENFFGAIRAQGHAHNMPNAFAFQAAFKTLLINNLTSPHSVGANCENDDSVCLHNLKNLINAETNVEIQHNIELDMNDLYIRKIDTLTLLQGKSQTDVERCAALAYCSGWLVTKLQNKIFKNCPACLKIFKSTEIESFHEYIKNSEYDKKEWLCYPTRQMFDCFAEIEHNVLEILKNNSNKKNICKYINLVLLTNIDFNFIECERHKQKLIDYLTHETVIFFLHNWCKDVNSILNGKTNIFDNDDPVKRDARSIYSKIKQKRRK